MQNFKQYLSEASNKLNEEFIFEVEGTIINSQLDNIWKELQSEFKDLCGQIWYEDEDTHIRYGFSSIKDYKTLRDPEYKIKIVNSIRKKLNDVEMIQDVGYYDSKTKLNHMPSESFPHYKGNISFTNDVEYLTDIHKIFPEILSLNLYSGKEIKGNVLGILKLKNLHVLKCEYFSKEMWFQIVQNNLKSKNVIECSEELIEAGLKEYAKF